jgi:hypothetical protein
VNARFVCAVLSTTRIAGCEELDIIREEGVLCVTPPIPRTVVKENACMVIIIGCDPHTKLIPNWPMHTLGNPVSCKCVGDRTQFEATMLEARKETHVVSVVSVTGGTQRHRRMFFFHRQCEAHEVKSKII